jgi:hypothetical protein
MRALPCRLLDVHLQIIEQVDDPSTLITLANMNVEWYDVSMRRWAKLPGRSLEDLLIMILAIERDSKLTSYVKNVSFICDAQSEEAHRKHSYTAQCSESCSQFLKDVEDKLAEVLKGQEEGTITAGRACSVEKSKLLPQILLGLLAPDVARSYALPANVDKIWCESLATGLRDPSTNPLRCLCLEGRSLYQLHLQLRKQSLIIETHALLLYGKPSDFTLRRWPENMPTFYDLKGIKWIGVSIPTWSPDDDGCNIFERFREYDEKYSKGSLEKVVVRVTREVIAKVCEAYDKCHWPKGRQIIVFHLWDIGNMSPSDAIAREFRDGTWCNCIDFPEMLGPKHTIESLRVLAKTVRPTNAISSSSGGFRASPSLLHQPPLKIAPKVSSWVHPNPIPLSIPPIRC